MTNADVINTGYADGFQAAVDQRDSRFVYTESQNGRLYLIDMITREERWISPYPADAKERYRFNWNTPLLAVPNDTSLVYYGAQRLLQTRDRGNTWQAVSPDLTTNPADWRRDAARCRASRTASRCRAMTASANYGTITTIGVTPKAPGTVYVGTDDGQVQMTTDSGAHWTNITSRFRLPGTAVGRQGAAVSRRRARGVRRVRRPQRRRPHAVRLPVARWRRDVGVDRRRPA